MAHKGALEQHFGLALSECEPPQFLRYQDGDFFVPHQDGNTPLIHDDSRFRKISAVLFLSAQADEPAPDSYGGGALVLHGPYMGPAAARADAGRARHAGRLPRRDHARGHAGHARRAVHHRVVVSVSCRIPRTREPHTPCDRTRTASAIDTFCVANAATGPLAGTTEASLSPGRPLTAAAGTRPAGRCRSSA